jgi:cell division protein ZapA
VSAVPQGVARVSVRILEKEYSIACGHDERAALLDSAELLNTTMQEIRSSGKIVGLDRIAVMAALNLAHDLLQLRHQEARTTSQSASVSTRVRHLRERVDAALTDTRQLDL